MRKLTSKEKRGLIYSLGIVSISLFIFFILTSDLKSVYNSLKNINLFYIGLLFLFGILFNIFNMVRIKFLIKSAGYSMSWKNVFHYTISGTFAGFITPMQSGGLPLQIYISKKENIPVSAAMSIVVMKGVILALVFLILLPVMFPLFVDYISSGKLRYLFGYFVFIYSLLFFIIILLSIFSKKILSIVFNMREGKLKKWIVNFLKGIDGFVETTIDFFRKGPKYFLLSLLFSFLLIATQSLMAPLILKSLGLSGNLFKSAVLQFLLIFLLSFAPTPGGAGIAEGSGWLLFKNVCPDGYISIYIILWRFFTSLFNVLIGAIGFFLFLKEENENV